MSELSGSMWIGGVAVSGQQGGVRGIDPARGTALEPLFGGAAPADIARACALAEAAFDPYRALPWGARATFLDEIAARIEALGDSLIDRAMLETGLPRARLEGERGRMCGQLRLFAQVVRDGAYLGVHVDPALPDRAPLPRPDLRLRHIPLGPVAVFGASNFPLAFSTAGGDTASALAAGCPVIVKAHSAHPGISALVGGAVVAAAAATGMPAGVFALLFDDGGHDVGIALVEDQRIKAVGFTGSRSGGLALAARAAARPEPIPFYAEMSSINPVVLLPAALARRSEAIAAAFAASLTLGAGQFCTNPGLLLAIDGPALDTFATAAGDAIAQVPAATMLTPGIAAAYRAGVAALDRHAQVRLVVRGRDGQGERAALHETCAAAFLADPALHAETFGASALLVGCNDADELKAVIGALEGQLTAALHLDEDDVPLARDLVPLLERKAGRLLVNGFGTGVEVASAMVHGGPYPATLDSRTTSVGTLAIHRFLRPVCYQDFPAALLPDELIAA